MAMFDETLLDSSVKREPVLKPIHWAIALGAGIIGFLVGYYGLGLVLAGTEGGALVTQSVTLGVLFAVYGLMLCYT